MEVSNQNPFESIASSSFVEVTTPCPLLLCLVGDQSVWQRATTPLLHAVPRSPPPLTLAGAVFPGQAYVASASPAAIICAAGPPELLSVPPSRRPGGPRRCS
ncbi:hypothetical protein Scep_019159 [Stephania cephalantha]|uniref:Uncharacterized protein n=1 Tax=Stephania cephalantha TaxID=152367 RepID=A0AAP0NMZ7_9MAGN